MKIKQGYKQTDIGVIPEDWEVVQVGNILSVTTGAKNTQDKKDDGVYPFFVRSQNVERINSFSYDCEGVLTAGDGVGTGKVFHYVNGQFDFHQRVYLMYNFAENIDGYFFYLVFKANFYNRMMQMTAKSSVDSVRKEMISEMQIALPPTKSEQQAIAQTLSDIDSLIEALDKKIAKKRAIKEGAMQQLLTGKKRLAGFTKPWVEKKFEQIIDNQIKKGQMLTASEYIEGNIPVIAGGKTPAGYHAYANKEKNTITISASGANAGFVAFHNNPIFATDCSTISESEKYDIKYIYYLLCLNQDVIYKAQTGGAQPHIHAKDIYPLEVLYTSNIKEQQSIAQILTDMDNEIEVLEKERQKYTALKQGAMQKLLTGEIRLFVEKSV